MRYYIKSIHWLDAMSPPLERHLDKLANSVQALFAASGEPLPTVEKTVINVPVQKPRAFPVWAITLLVFVAIGILVGIGAWVLQQNKEGPLALSTLGSLAEVTQTPNHSPAEAEGEWRTLNFIIPNETLWHQEDGSYSIIAKPSENTIAWSDEIIEGDFRLSAQVTSEHPDGQAQFVVYGDGAGFSDGCLIFTYGPGFALITRDTIYHEGENWLVVNEGDYGFRESTHDFTIEITGDVANFYVDGEKVAFTFLPVETKHQGRMGIFQHWEEPLGMTYSNLKIKLLGSGD